MIIDQRHDHRVSFFLGGDVYLMPEGSRVGRALIRDVSASGMRIETLGDYKVGQRLYLDFQVDGKYQFQKISVDVTRVYRHSGSYLLGLAFHEPQDRRRMRDALTYVMQNAQV